MWVLHQLHKRTNNPNKHPDEFTSDSVNNVVSMRSIVYEPQGYQQVDTNE